MNKAPQACSVCGSGLEAVRLQCQACGTALEGHFEVSVFSKLTPEQHQFLLLFLRSRGNIKEVERALGLSYPTVRSRLDALLQTLGLAGGSEPSVQARRRIDILDDLEAGRITVAEALEQFKTIDTTTA
jgi:hypothetical protein